jgi:acetyltransferase-like isoleucine patch superfamily enzyme
LVLGNNVYFAKRADVRPPDFAHFGDDVAVGYEFFVDQNLKVGSDVLISSRVSIIGNDHLFDNPTKSVYWAGRYPPATVHLEGDNLIGFGVIILGNVRIGKGCIVGAGAVVTRDLPANTICVGIPAKPIKNRFQDDLGTGDLGGAYESQL